MIILFMFLNLKKYQSLQLQETKNHQNTNGFENKKPIFSLMVSNDFFDWFQVKVNFMLL